MFLGSHSPPAHFPLEPRKKEAVWQYASTPRNLHFPPCHILHVLFHQRPAFIPLPFKHDLHKQPSETTPRAQGARLLAILASTGPMEQTGKLKATGIKSLNLLFTTKVQRLLNKFEVRTPGVSCSIHQGFQQVSGPTLIGNYSAHPDSGCVCGRCRTPNKNQKRSCMHTQIM